MYNKLSRKIKLLLFVIIFIVSLILLFLPKDFFDTGQSICLSVVFFDVECFGCGMTRAIQHLIHFDFTQAWEFNKMSFVAFPLIVFLLIKEFIRVLKSKE